MINDQVSHKQRHLRIMILTSGIPQEIRDFLNDCIESVSQLELLFLIYEQKTNIWTAESISKEMRTHASMAQKQMEVLVHKGILKKENEHTFSYAPVKDITDERVKQLYHLYHVKPVSIVTYIYTKPEDKLKGFADAFKFKKD